ncbi:MAG: tRNA (adenosine(37)-N6)-threonylcarbamoyltransferase complex dimerization subunit type 1 TsaB [Candidatus Hydrogenedentes bacterium]|nr:tRNA (adenosine(37)-N6)-threonylcarbamoyltransferase complex dimerization subunit type 1 TsaB [Candidatus Hydrogenedentota bacterium]
MYILSADTSTDINTVSILKDNDIVGEITINAGKRHSERLISLIQTILNEAQLTLNNINLLAISIGPGSFTGLRVGLSTWKGLALATGIPLIGVPTLYSMSRLAPFNNAVVCPVIDARMKEVYAGIFLFEKDKRTILIDNFLGSIETFTTKLTELVKDKEPNLYVYGNGALMYREKIKEKFPWVNFGPEWWAHPRASTVGVEALEMWRNGYNKNLDEILPIYLRLSQPEELRKKLSCQTQ